MSSSKLNLDAGVVSSCRQAAKRIAEDVFEQIASRTTVSVERSITRLLGVDGADELEVPLPNVLVEHVAARGGLERGIASGSATRWSRRDAAPSRSPRG